MIGLLGSEVLKLVTTRGFLGLVAGAAAVAALGTASTVLSAESARLDGALQAQVFFLLAAINVGLFALVVGIRSFTDEFRHGTLVGTWLARPRAGWILAAKTVVSAVAAAGMAVVALVIVVGLALGLSELKGGSLAFAPSDLPAMAGFLAAMAVWGALGAGIGAVVRHQVAAIVGGVIWILVVENLGAGFLREWSRFLPGQAAHALARVTQVDALLAQPAAALLLAGYLALVVGLAVTTLARRDLL